MEKYDLNLIVKDAWETCIKGGKEKQYVTKDDILIVVASYVTCKEKVDPEIEMSEACRSLNPAYKGIVVIIKEDVEKCDKDLMKFVILHEIGHLKCNHQDMATIKTLQEDIIREKEADYYAMEKGGFYISEALDIMETIHEKYIYHENEEVRNFFKEKLKIRLQNIKEFKKSGT